MFTLENIGLTQDEIQKRVVNAITAQCMTAVFRGYGPDGEPCDEESPNALAKLIHIRIQKLVDAKLDSLFAKYILPAINTYVDNLCLQETTKWGQKKGP